MTLLRRLRKLLNPPRRYYRCSDLNAYLPGCGAVIERRWLPAPSFHVGRLAIGKYDCGKYDCGRWVAISAASASAQRHRMGA